MPWHEQRTQLAEQINQLNCDDVMNYPKKNATNTPQYEPNQPTVMATNPAALSIISPGLSYDVSSERLSLTTLYARLRHQKITYGRRHKFSHHPWIPGCMRK